MAASWDQKKFFASLGPLETIAEVFLLAFLKGVQTNLTELRLAHQQHNYQQIARLAHSIKGSSGQIGCLLLSEQASQLEFFAQKEIANVPFALESLYEQADLEIDCIRSFMNTKG